MLSSMSSNRSNRSNRRLTRSLVESVIRARSRTTSLNCSIAFQRSLSRLAYASGLIFAGQRVERLQPGGASSLGLGAFRRGLSDETFRSDRVPESPTTATVCTDLTRL